MTTRVLLIEAGPTPWDDEGRIVGARPLPLTAEAIDAIGHLLESLDSRVESVYRAPANEACDQAAKLVAHKFSIRARANADLEAVHLGLWEGLTPEEVRSRFPTVFPQWLENPQAVTPPDGERLDDAIARIHAGLRRVLRANRGRTVAMPVRPMTLQIADGLLQGQNAAIIGPRLHQRQPLATIEVDSAKW
jgi:broad specificity phosphatase PhoE